MGLPTQYSITPSLQLVLSLHAYLPEKPLVFERFHHAIVDELVRARFPRLGTLN
jgi:hypothetical protein